MLAVVLVVVLPEARVTVLKDQPEVIPVSAHSSQPMGVGAGRVAYRQLQQHPVVVVVELLALGLIAAQHSQTLVDFPLTMLQQMFPDHQYPVVVEQDRSLLRLLHQLLPVPNLEAVVGQDNLQLLLVLASEDRVYGVVVVVVTVDAIVQCQQH